MPILFSGDAKTAYRDPCCYYLEGVYHLFMTVSVKEDGYMYNHVGSTASRVPDAFPPPRLLTEHDRTKNYSSPGSILRVGDRYLLCICSYPLRLPFKKDGIADGSARLYCIETADFEHFTEPRRLYPPGPATSDEGRMIDPFWMRDATDAGRYLLFYKQNGVSLSESRDLVSWTWLGRADGGENASVLFEDGRYLLVHSPQNGIGLKV